MNANELRAKLNAGVITVKFKKKDGSPRTMVCTTNLEHIPPSAWPKGEVQLTEETRSSTIRVYDTRASAWRSFIVENVTEVSE